MPEIPDKRWQELGVDWEEETRGLVLEILIQEVL
jgi:hypothetical protein